jgi:penicillin-binding protein 1A
MEKELGYESWFRRHRRGLLVTLGALLTLAVLLACAVGIFVVQTLKGAPPLDLADITPEGYRTNVLDDAGQPILTLIGEESNRVYVTLDQIPEHLQKAFVAIEDARFYTHHGLDIRGILRAAWRNLTSGSLSEGASTITQQLIKNNVFSGWAEEQSAMARIERKLQEQLLALELEKTRGKDWILENYLNTINRPRAPGGGETASLRYFGKDVSALTLSESAVLAGIAQSPSGYDPLLHPDRNAARRVLVLDRMLSEGYIDQTDYDEAQADEVYARIEERADAGGVDILSYFEDAMVYQLVADMNTKLGLSEADAWQLIYRGGLTIESTQNTELQTICEEEINRENWYRGDEQASIVVIDPATGQVKAIVGGRGEKTASLTLNRATDSVRQSGSTIKVVGEYAAALDKGGVTLGTVYDDAPYAYSDGTPLRNANGAYAGKITVHQAIADSVNIVALKCFQDAGMDEVWGYLGRFGFAHLDPGDKVEALALGGTRGGVTDLEMTAAYAAIADGGVYIEPSYYTRVLDHAGNVLLERENKSYRVIQPATAAELTAAMEDVFSSTGAAAYFGGMSIAGKSGTTTDMRDVWFVGFSPYYACGVWGGYDSYEAQTSSTYVKQIWRSVMQRAHAGLTDPGFVDLGQLEKATICTKCGNLAVPGLCDDTLQGDVTAEEYFAPGTVPTEQCTCHVRLSICQASGHLANSYCPEDEVETAVYLKEGTAGTADEKAAAPDVGDDLCDVHHSRWDWLFPDEEQPYEPERPWRNWWSWWW